MRKIISLFIALAFQTYMIPTFAEQRLPDDLVTVGKPSSAANKRIKFKGTTQELRANTTTNKLEYTNDGAVYKPIGSGSGSGGSTGTNLITNDSFEDGIGSPWTSSGGAFSQQIYTVGAEDDTKFARFIATTSGQYVEQIVSVKTNLGAGCQADFKKVNIATAGLFKVQALDVSNNILAEQTIGVSSWIKVPTISFLCPAPGTNNLKLRLISLAAGTIDFDRGYIGSNQNLVYSSQAKLVGTISWASTANCAWNANSITWVNFVPDSDCPTPSVTGDLIAPATKIPGFSIKNASAGTYYFVANGLFYRTTAGSSGYRIGDGTLFTASNPNYAANGSSHGSVVGTIQRGVSAPLWDLQIQGFANAGLVQIELDSPANYEDLNIQVYFYPSASEVAVSNEQSSWFIDVNIGGANSSMGTTQVSSYSPLGDSNLDMVINSNKGSANAEIPCSGGVSSTGITCSGASEQIGIAFIPPSAGVFKICGEFSHQSNGSNAGFQLIETPNNSATILQEGGERINSFATSANSSGSSHFPHKVCGNFTFSDTSKKTIRLMYEQDNVATVGTVLGDRSSTSGQRDIHFSVVPLLSAYNRPILTGDQVRTPGALNPESFIVSYGTSTPNSVCSVGPCSYLDQIGNNVSSIGRPGVGSYSLNTVKTYSKLKCIHVPMNVANNLLPVDAGTCNNCNTLAFGSAQPGAGRVDSYGNLFCVGQP
jgi:hypothetical protein